jgi:hypothetical protein
VREFSWLYKYVCYLVVAALSARLGQDGVSERGSSDAAGILQGLARL